MMRNVLGRAGLDPTMGHFEDTPSCDSSPSGRVLRLLGLCPAWYLPVRSLVPFPRSPVLLRKAWSCSPPPSRTAASPGVVCAQSMTASPPVNPGNGIAGVCVCLRTTLYTHTAPMSPPCAVPPPSSSRWRAPTGPTALGCGCLNMGAGRALHLTPRGSAPRPGAGGVTQLAE